MTKHFYKLLVTQEKIGKRTKADSTDEVLLQILIVTSHENGQNLSISRTGQNKPLASQIQPFQIIFTQKSAFCQELACTDYVLMASTYTLAHGRRVISPCLGLIRGVLVSSSATSRPSPPSAPEPGSTCGLLSQPGPVTTNCLVTRAFGWTQLTYLTCLGSPLISLSSPTPGAAGSTVPWHIN